MSGTTRLATFGSDEDLMVFVFPLLQKKGGEGKPIIAILHVDDYTGSLKSIHKIKDFFFNVLGLKLSLLCWKSFHFLPPCPQLRGTRAQQEQLHRYQNLYPKVPPDWCVHTAETNPP